MAKAARQTVWDELDTVQVASNINRPLGSLEHMLARQGDQQQYRPFSHERERWEICSAQ